LSFDLHPTSYLEVANRKTRRRRLGGAEGEDITHELADYYHDDAWFEEGQNAVYATIPDGDSTSTNPRLRDFYATRHLSRYELQHRRNLGMDLQLGWNGTYVEPLKRVNQLRLLESTYESYVPESNSSTARLRRRLTGKYSSTTTTANAAAAAAATTTVASTGPVYGGQFDSYQAVPLSQGYGTHFAR
jgi:hypothetical protein